MATTTANKGGLRAAATARTNKAAQRTPLPPRKGEAVEIAELAAEIQAEAKPARKRAPRIRKPAGEDSVSVLDAETAALVAEEAPKPARKPRAKKVEPAEEPIVVEEATPKGFKIPTEGTKAHRASVAFAEAGWDITVTVDGEWAEMVAKRGAETIHQGWLNGVYDHDRSGTYTLADRTVRTRNLSEARKWADRDSKVATAEFAKVNSNTHFRKRAVALSAPKGMPFDLETSSDEEIVKALAGSKVKWHNVYKVEEEDAAIPANSPHTRIVEVPQVGDRPTEKAILFCCPASGFRAFRLSALRKVGRNRV